MYHLHHCVMHHVGNNQSPADASSTAPYQRDSLAAFLRYWLRFALLAWLEVRRAAGEGECRCESGRRRHPGCLAWLQLATASSSPAPM